MRHEKRKKFIMGKLNEMLDSGETATGDFSGFDNWDQSQTEQRNLTPEEQQQLRDEAKKQIEQHRQNKLQ